LVDFHFKIEPEALNFIISSSSGDARKALNILEMVSSTENLKTAKKKKITKADVKTIIQKQLLYYDKKADYHYDTISALIKSIRGSDPDAALFWLARMIIVGDDPRFIARRLVILASEDIGNADPHALMVATTAAQAVDFVGLPEAQLNLAQAVTYLASAPKSNALYLGLLAAKKDAQNEVKNPVPLHLRNAPTELMKNLNFGQGYKYVHDFSGHYVNQQYLPDKLKSRRYYHPENIGFEAKIKERLENLRKKSNEK